MSLSEPVSFSLRRVDSLAKVPGGSVNACRHCAGPLAKLFEGVIFCYGPVYR